MRLDKILSILQDVKENYGNIDIYDAFITIENFLLNDILVMYISPKDGKYHILENNKDEDKRINTEASRSSERIRR